MSKLVAAGASSLTERQLNRTTLLRQSLLDRAAEEPASAIHRLAGLQAQYANSPYIALWSRLRDFAIAHLEDALERRQDSLRWPQLSDWLLSSWRTSTGRNPCSNAQGPGRRHR